MPERPKFTHIDWIALWIALMGVWPLADPGHAANTPLSLLDLMLHGGAAFVLFRRWRVTLVRRERRTDAHIQW